MADSMATHAHISLQQVLAPFSKSDIRTRSSSLGKSKAEHFWKKVINDSSSLKHINPYLMFRAPRGLKRQCEAILHRIRLKVSYTNYYLYLIGKLETPNCSECETIEDITHSNYMSKV